MLKITVLDGAAGQKLVVEGKLAEPWVSEFESAWNQVRQAGRGSRIVVDLSQITFIDSRGEAVLMAMIADGARLTAKGLYSEYVVKQLMNRARKARALRNSRHAVGAKDSSSAKESSQVDGHSQSKERQ